MICVFCKAATITRIGKGGSRSEDVPKLTERIELPCVPRVGEQVELCVERQISLHTVVGVRQVVDVWKGKLEENFALVFVSEPLPSSD
jgi:hypothetical protein